MSFVASARSQGGDYGPTKSEAALTERRPRIV